jgi:pimeloyl-ACP methyl ester carboxylesterase
VSEADAFVLIHGAHHGSWVWERLGSHLSLPIVAIDLPGRNGPASGTDATSVAGCAALVAERIEQAGIQRAVLVGHSLGGVVAYTVAAEHADTVAHLVGISAVFPPPGHCALDLWPRGLRWAPRARMMLRHGGATAPLTISDGRARRSLAHDLDPATTEWLLDRLGPEIPGILTTPVSSTPLSSEISRTYVLCRNDRALSVARQRRHAEALAAQIVELDSGHEAMLTLPDELAEILNMVASSRSSARP